MMGEIEEIIVFFLFFGIYVFLSKEKKVRGKATYFAIIICRSFL